MFHAKWSWRRTVFAAALVLILSVTAPAALQAQNHHETLKQTLSLVIDVLKQWHKDSDTFDEAKLIDAAIRGAVNSIGDPHTNYFTPTEYRDFLNSLEGTFSGVGMYLEKVDQYITVVSPIRGSPAAEAGLQSGDRILEADGVNLVGEPIETAVRLIRGPEGTRVTLKMERPSEGRVFTVTLTRRLISIPSVEGEIIDGDIGHIELMQFSSDAPQRFFRMVRDLEAKGARGFIIDMRNNPGGYLDAAIEIAEAFVGQGKPIIVTAGRGGAEETRFSRSDSRLITRPVVVLVNQGSASATEIVAGAVQDHAVAKLVGTKTFGKGTVQQLLTMNGGHGLKVTTMEYFTANKRKVHGVGLTPDVVVEKYQGNPERVGLLETNQFIRFGDVSLTVQRIQFRLNDIGYTIGDERGAFHLRMLNQVHRFQQTHGLPQSDIIDENFMAKLNAEVAKAAAAAAKKDLQLAKALELLREAIGSR
jgi:carboxyl-terminal processing protease